MTQFSADIRKRILCGEATEIEDMRRRVDVLIEELEERGITDVASDVRRLRTDEPFRSRDVYGLHGCSDRMYQSRGYQAAALSPYAYAKFVVGQALGHKIDLAVDACYAGSGTVREIPLFKPYLAAFDLAWSASEGRRAPAPTSGQQEECAPKG